MRPFPVLLVVSGSLLAISASFLILGSIFLEGADSKGQTAFVASIWAVAAFFVGVHASGFGVKLLESGAGTLNSVSTRVERLVFSFSREVGNRERSLHLLRAHGTLQTLLGALCTLVSLLCSVFKPPERDNGASVGTAVCVGVVILLAPLAAVFTGFGVTAFGALASVQTEDGFQPPHPLRFVLVSLFVIAFCYTALAAFSFSHLVLPWEPSTHTELMVGGGFVQNGVAVTFAHAVTGVLGMIHVFLGGWLAVLALHQGILGAKAFHSHGRGATYRRKTTRAGHSGRDPISEKDPMFLRSVASEESPLLSESRGRSTQSSARPTIVTRFSCCDLLSFSSAVVIVSVFMLSLFAPPIWNVPFQGHAYFGSPFALGGGISLPSGFPGVIDTRWGDDAHLSLKLYFDVFMFFAAGSVLVFLGAVGTRCCNLSPIFSRRHAVPRRLVGGPLKIQSAYPLGSILTGALVTILLFSWIFYFGFYYERTATLNFGPQNEWNPLPVVNRIAPVVYRLVGDNEINLPEVIARTAGHAANLLLALLLVPLTRNSALFALLNTSFEQVLGWHRILGALFAAAIVIHAGVWCSVWLANGTVFEVLATVRPCGLHMGGDFPAGHCDNVTVIVIGFLSLVFLGGLLPLAAEQYRRRFFALFLMAHHWMAWVLLAAALLHAWGLWPVLSVPLLLLLVDVYVRSIRSAEGWIVVRAVAVPNPDGTSSDSDPSLGLVTVLTLRPCEGTTKRQPRAGQFAMLWLAPVSVSNVWHPFTIAETSLATLDAPALVNDEDAHAGDTEQLFDSELLQHVGDEQGWGKHSVGTKWGGSSWTFCIKSNGRGTWTGRLAEEAVAGNLTNTLARVDGPYGSPPEVGAGRFKHILLVAGGIGITPALAVLQRVGDEWATSSGAAQDVPSIHLVWTVREQNVVEVAAPLLHTAVAACGSAALLTIDVYVSSVSREADELFSDIQRILPSSPTTVAHAGRPDISLIVGRAPPGKQTLTYSCGPAPLVEASLSAGHKRGHFLAEDVFAW